MRRYYVYILAGPSAVLYTGVTNSLRHRVIQHRLKLVKGFTQKYNVTRLVHFEMFSSIGMAIAREKQIKAWSRKKRIALIESQNPRWKDLAEEWCAESLSLERAIEHERDI